MSEIFYCGDTSSKSAAAYLLGVLNYCKYSVNYLPSHQKCKTPKQQPKLIILSDYPAKNINTKQQETIFEWVNNGSSFWMIGGWESYYGLHGEYTKKWEEILPVIIQNKDDRVNSFTPYVLNPIQKQHPILKNLPWGQGPAIGGFNKVKPKNNALILLEGIPFSIQNKEGKLSGKQGKPAPIIVEGKFGSGKTLALMTDLAPHWVGGFVDWGNQRIPSQGKNANQVETGHLYVKFIQNIVGYLM